MKVIKYTCLLFIILLSPQIHSQTLRVDYDKLIFQGKVKNNAVLFIDGNFAQFKYAHKGRTVKVDFFNVRQDPVRYFINTNVKEKKVTEYRRYKSTLFKAEWGLETDWTITNETTQILGYKAIKAFKVSSRGHKTFAWFTPHIPIPVGPFRKSGLPGLILKITYSDRNDQVVATKISEIRNHKFKSLEKEKALEITKSEIKNFNEGLLKDKIEEAEG